VFLVLLVTSSFLLAEQPPTDSGRGMAVVAVEPLASTASEGNAALFVGVNRFTEDRTLRTLEFAVNDAIAQAHLFVAELKLVSPANCFLALSGDPTTDSAKEQLRAVESLGVSRGDAKKTALLRTLQGVASLPKDRGNLVIVSISSHGFEEGGVVYVMPADGLRSDLAETALRLQSVEERLQKSQAGKRLLVVDACRERSVSQGRGSEDAMSAAFRKALVGLEGQAVLASCDAGQMSLENPALGHGVFTYHLLQGLRGGARADARGFVTLGSVSEYLTQSVRDWVGRQLPEMAPRAQRPWFKGSEEMRSLPLAVARVTRPGEAPVVRVEPAPMPTPPSAPSPQVLPAVTPAMATRENPFINSLGMKFVPVPGTDVLFCIWDTRVQDYQAFATTTGQLWEKPSFEQGPTHPAVNIGWDNAKAFCEWLTQKERSAGLIGSGQSYRLPMDVEWSVAVGLQDETGRTPQEKDGMTRGVYPWGSGFPPPRGAGNYDSLVKADSYEYTSPVGSFAANRFGLYDMGGNVWQWCEDSYGGGQDGHRLLRGASWGTSYPVNLLSSCRFVTPDLHLGNVGFRVVLTLTPKTHTVAKGDSLAGIAHQYGTTVAALKRANALSRDVIRVGQKLIIPAE